MEFDIVHIRKDLRNVLGNDLNLLAVRVGGNFLVGTNCSHESRAIIEIATHDLLLLIRDAQQAAQTENAQ